MTRREARGARVLALSSSRPPGRLGGATTIYQFDQLVAGNGLSGSRCEDGGPDAEDGVKIPSTERIWLRKSYKSTMKTFTKHNKIRLRE